MEKYSFYDEFGKIKEYNCKYLDSGFFGNIYRVGDDICLKIFTKNYDYDIEAIKKIKELKLDNFYQIYDLLFNKDNIFVGYTSKYYDNQNIDILSMETAYTLNNLYALYNSFNILSKEGIFVDDVNDENIIFDEKKITVIDTDLYCYNKDKVNKRYLIRKNYHLLLYLFSAIYYRALMKKENNYIIDEAIIDIILDDLFDISKGIKCIEKKLIKYKYPIDYIRSKEKYCEF